MWYQGVTNRIKSYLQRKDSGQYGISDDWGHRGGCPGDVGLDPPLLAGHRLRAPELSLYY